MCKDYSEKQITGMEDKCHQYIFVEFLLIILRFFNTSAKQYYWSSDCPQPDEYFSSMNDWKMQWIVFSNLLNADWRIIYFLEWSLFSGFLGLDCYHCLDLNRLRMLHF